MGLITAGAWAAKPRAQESLRALLPADGDAKGWLKDGDPQEFVGEDLYTYIDGGAEIYQEYGFRRVVVQDYENAAGKSVSLEIFEMETPAAAFGIFTFKRSGQGKSIAVGAGAELEDYYLNFWKGRFLLTLTGFDDSAGTIEGLLAVAGTVDAKIAGTSKPPDLVAALPEPGLKPGSAKYFKGLLGLNNVYSFQTARGLAFTEAVKGDYGDAATLIVMDYGSAEARASAWNELRGFLEGSDRFARSASGQGAPPLFRDAKGRYLAFAAAGPRLLLGISPEPSASIAMVGQSR
jgi:hypothetical protein